MALARGRRVALDTNVISYLLDPAAALHLTARSVLQEANASSVTASVIALSEVLVKAYQDGGTQAARRVRRAVEQIPGLTLTNVSVEVAQLAAAIRARTRLRLADAIHLASASAVGSDVFLTNVRDFRNVVAGLDVVLLSELA